MPRRKTHAEFVAEVEALYEDEYAVVSKYTLAKNKLKVKHNNCEHIYTVEASAFLRGSMCPYCKAVKTGERSRKTHTFFVGEVLRLVGTEYSVLSKYKNSQHKIKIKHNICGNIYSVTPTHFLSGRRCPRCRESRGERAVADCLSKMHVSYDRQYKFNDCRNTNSLPFDFVVYNSDKSLKCLVEYDGEYHFIAKEHSGGEKGLRGQQRRDAIKTKYCADHNIPLIRIPYWEFDNIDAILTKELAKLDVLQEV